MLNTLINNMLTDNNQESIKIKDNESQYYTAASLFAGIGGFCSAFKSAGFNVVWANEVDQFAIQTYRQNYPDVNLYTKSIADLSVVSDHILPVDVLTAGFPCQPFSIAGEKKGFNDPRGQLFFHIIRLLRELGANRPKIILMENVKNLLFHDKGKTFTRIVEEIQSAGYWFNDTNVRVLNTKDYTDIPQLRERLYMVAFSWDYFDYNDFQFPEKESKTNDVKEYLDLAEEADSELYFDENSKYGQMFIESMKEGNIESVYQLRKYYVRENKSNSVPTLTANMGEGGHNVPVIKDPWGIRKLSPIECLRLQGFIRNDFTFPTGMSKTQQYRQIGNAVTLPLVEKLAVECKKHIQKLKEGKA